MNALFRTVNKEEATAIQKRKQRFNTQEPQQTSSTTGRKLHLPQDLYKDVVTSASRFKGQPGFGVRLIKAAATFTYNKAYKHLLDNANWVPSQSWCYCFLHNVMSYSFRRITGAGRISGPLTNKQEELWGVLLDTLAVDFMEGLRPDFLISSDEFGQFFFSHT